ncbi:MAG: hypothetical protein JWQ71_652 [Pedosphaera sp.]|nr:hypothetical protein [Pedosphaera sp.]
MKEEIIYESPSSLPRQPILRRISWAAIFAGLIIALVSQLVLSVLGVSIGATAVNPLTADQSSGQALGIGAGIWLIVSSIISLFLGGWVAGRMAGFTREGALHGLVTWGAATLLTVLLLTSAAGGLLSGAGKLVSQAMPVAGQAMASSSGGSDNSAMGSINSALQGVSGGRGDSVQQDVQSLNQNNPAQSAKLTAAVGRMLKNEKNGSVNPNDRQAVVSMLVSQNNMSEQEANQRVDRWIQDSQQTKAQTEQKARQAGDKAAKGVSVAGWLSFGMLVLGAVAAGLGGASGAKALARSRIAEAPAAA